jgi:hypothetical protein
LLKKLDILIWNAMYSFLWVFSEIYLPDINPMEKLAFIFLFLLVSCLPQKGPLVYSLTGVNETLETELPSVISFEMIQQKILLPKCVACHSWVNDSAQVNRRLVPGEPDSSRLFRILENGRMPPRPSPALGTDELELLRGYIMQLAR